MADLLSRSRLALDSEFRARVQSAVVAACVDELRTDPPGASTKEALGELLDRQAFARRVLGSIGEWSARVAEAIASKAADAKVDSAFAGDDAGIVSLVAIALNAFGEVARRKTQSAYDALP